MNKKKKNTKVQKGVIFFTELGSLCKALFLLKRKPMEAIKTMRSLKHFQLKKVGKSILPLYDASFVKLLQGTAYWLFILNISTFLLANFFNILTLNGGFVFLFCYVILYVLSGVLTYTVLSSFNYIVSLVYLIFLFSLTGLILMFCGINFVGLTLIAVYVGGVLLLFLSVIKFLGFRAGDSMYLSDLYSGLIRGLLEISRLLCFLLVVFVLFYFALQFYPIFFNIVVSK